MVTFSFRKFIFKGHCNASRKNQQWKSLGHWVRQQRRKRKQSKLTDYQIEILDALGFEWDRSYYLYAKVPHKDKLPHPPSTYVKYHQALNSPSIKFPLSLASIAAMEAAGNKG